MLIAHLRLGLFLATLVASLHVHAETRYWTLAGVQLEDGAVATGYFSYDDATGTIVDWNVRLSGGAAPFIPWTYVPANSRLDPGYPIFSAYSSLPGLSRDPTAWWRSLVIARLGPLDGSSTTVSIDVSRSREAFESDLSRESIAIEELDSRKIIAGSLVLTTSPPPTQQVDINQHGLTGSWHTPGANGQGIEIEVYQHVIAPGIGYLHAGFATHAVGWETGQRWYTLGGTVRTGETSSTLVIFQNTGGNFNAPSATLSIPIGTMLLTFVDCNTAVMEYRDLRLDVEPPFAGWGPFSGLLPLLRLTPNISCSLDGASRQDADFSYSGHWFSPATSGQGLFVELNRIAEVSFMVWYTYASDGASRGVEGQRWYTGQGRFVPGARTLPLTLYETTGRAIFDWQGAIIPSSTQIAGTATVTFFGCNAARLAFAFTEGSNAGASGTINLSRVGPAPADCLP